MVRGSFHKDSYLLNGNFFNNFFITLEELGLEGNNIFYEEQAGYKTGYSTIHNILIFQVDVQKYITKKKGSMYCIFINFSKAFDSVQHKLLYFIPIKNGIGGKVFGVLRFIYSKLKSCERSWWFNRIF